MDVANQAITHRAPCIGKRLPKIGVGSPTVVRGFQDGPVVGCQDRPVDNLLQRSLFCHQRVRKGGMAIRSWHRPHLHSTVSSPPSLLFCNERQNDGISERAPKFFFQRDLANFPKIECARRTWPIFEGDAHVDTDDWKANVV